MFKKETKNSMNTKDNKIMNTKEKKETGGKERKIMMLNMMIMKMMNMNNKMMKTKEKMNKNNNNSFKLTWKVSRITGRKNTRFCTGNVTDEMKTKHNSINVIIFQRKEVTLEI
jgi:hypothetical protein